MFVEKDGRNPEGDTQPGSGCDRRRVQMSEHNPTHTKPSDSQGGTNADTGYWPTGYPKKKRTGRVQSPPIAKSMVRVVCQTPTHGPWFNQAKRTPRYFHAGGFRFREGSPKPPKGYLYLQYAIKKKGWEGVWKGGGGRGRAARGPEKGLKRAMTGWDGCMEGCGGKEAQNRGKRGSGEGREKRVDPGKAGSDRKGKGYMYL